MAHVILKCVREERLRIRFHQFIGESGKIYNNAYNNNYNCQFPRNIRKEGCYYRIPHENITLSIRRGKPYYIIKKTNIDILTEWKNNKSNEDKDPLDGVKIYDVKECVICMDNKSTKVYLPCGHKCTCTACSKMLCNNNNKKKCPLCRRFIIKVI